MKIVPGASAAVKEIIAARREKANADAEARRKELWRVIPEIREIDKRLDNTGLLILDEISKGYEGIEERIYGIRAENEMLIAHRGRLLLDAGYPENYSDAKYHCEKCSDTGYEGERLCECVKKEFVRFALEFSGLGALVNKQSFENFSLDYYEGVAKARAAKNKEICEDFAESFGNAGVCTNLLFMGTTGLGKTHLSTSVAKRVIERGYYVVYVSAQSMISDFASLRYGMGNAEDDEKTEKYFDCDLLIIDDLGTELQTSFSVSAIYNVVNSRLCNDKSMLISTNLSPAELKKIYAERITSRLFGNFSPLLFEGKDIRMVKLEKKIK